MHHLWGLLSASATYNFATSVIVIIKTYYVRFDVLPYTVYNKLITTKILVILILKRVKNVV